MNNRSTHRVGVVGVGGRGLELAHYCAQLSNAKLVAVADPLPEKLDRAAQKLQPVQLACGAEAE